MPKASIVMPVYNAALYLFATLNSISEQTFTDWDLIIIDDGSTDDSVARIKAFMFNHPQHKSKIRLIEQENSGAPTARNRGILHSTGEYIALIDADDYWYPEKLEKQVVHLDNNPEVGCSFVWSDFIDDNDNDLPGGQHHPTHDLTFEQLILINPVGNGSTPVIRREYLEMVGGFDTELKGSQDIDLWYRLFFQGCKFEGIPEVLCLYRIVQSGVSANYERKLASWEDVMRKLKEYAPVAYDSYYSLAKAYQLRYLARRAVSKYEGRQAVKLMAQALKEDKRVLFNRKSLITIAASLLLSIRK